MIRAALTLCCLCAALPGRGAEVDVDRFLAAISAVEDWRGRDGALGERGPYQFRLQTWRQHMPGVAFAESRRPSPSRACALKHVAWISAGLRAAGHDVNPFNLALAWNAGLARVLSGRAPESAYDYARRVENLYFARPRADKQTHP